MAFYDDNTQDVSGLPVNDELAKLQLQQRLKMAQALQEQQAAQGQMVGNRYVAPSWTQHLANMAGKVVGGMQEREALNKYGEYQKTKAQKQAKALEDFGKVFSERPEVTQSEYAIQVPGESTPTSPWTSEQGASKTIQVPMSTTEMRKPTQAEIEQGFANYARASDNPKLIETILAKKYEQAIAPKQTDWKALEGKL